MALAKTRLIPKLKAVFTALSPDYCDA